MSILDLRCQEAVSFLSGSCNACVATETLLLGGDNQIFLSFDFPPYAYLKLLKQAKLILFKIPLQMKTASDYTSYSAYPLLDYFSVYSCMYDPPMADYGRHEIFVDKQSCAYTEADITNVVKDWIEEEIENKGLLLTGNINKRLITYASGQYHRKGMRPKLRLIYEDSGICPPMSTTSCTVDVES